MKKVVITIDIPDADYKRIGDAIDSNIVGAPLDTPHEWMLNELLSNLDYEGFGYMRGTSEVGESEFSDA